MATRASTAGGGEGPANGSSEIGTTSNRIIINSNIRWRRLNIMAGGVVTSNSRRNMAGGAATSNIRRNMAVGEGGATINIINNLRMNNSSSNSNSSIALRPVNFIEADRDGGQVLRLLRSRPAGTSSSKVSGAGVEADIRRAAVLRRRAVRQTRAI